MNKHRSIVIMLALSFALFLCCCVVLSVPLEAVLPEYPRDEVPISVYWVCGIGNADVVGAEGKDWWCARVPDVPIEYLTERTQRENP